MLVVGATAETPGALLLAGLAALRVGAGRLQVAVPDTVAPLLAVRLPEAQVLSLGTHRTGTVAPSDRLAEAIADADAVLVGSGLGDPSAGRVLLDSAVASMAGGEGALVVDAAGLAALGAAPRILGTLAQRSALIPNLGEAVALGAGDVAEEDPEAAVVDLVERFGCAVAVRGPSTWIGAPAQATVVERAGPVGLGTSGSGDVLAGMVTGHLARGASPFDALVWAVHLHAAAGRALAERCGETGLLARELIDAIAQVRRSLGSVLRA